MISFRLPDGRAATVTLRPDATVLATGDECVSSYDLCGRPYVLARSDATYRRALDGRLLEKRPAGEGSGGRLRRVLSAAEGAPVVEAARREAETVMALVEGGAGPSAAAAEAAGRLRGIVSMDAAALAQDVGRFSATYRPIGILPPDQYLALVLQATEGCSWNRCSFCELYRGVPFRVKSVAEFEDHVAAVRAYFGPSLALRRRLFLGDASALTTAHDRLCGMLDVARRAFPEAAGLFSFLDVWTGGGKTAGEYREYARLGLRRVYVGLETGDAPLLEWLGKPGAPDEAVELVAALHEAGVAAGVIVLVGAGGDRFAAAHLAHTALTLRRMGLGGGDIVYLSELVADPGGAYARRAAEEGVHPLDAAGLAAQRRALAAAVAAAGREEPPRCAVYDLREFVY